MKWTSRQSGTLSPRHSLPWAFALVIALWPTATHAGPKEIRAVQLHLHGSISEGTGRMINHAIRARQADIDAIWWTDHSGMYEAPFPEDIEAFSMDFESGALWIPDDGIVKAHGFIPPAEPRFTHASVIDTTAADGLFSMALVADGGSSGTPAFEGWEYDVEWHHAVKSLFQDLHLHFDARLDTPVPGRIFTVKARLSGDLNDAPMWLAFMATDGPLPENSDVIRYARMPVPASGSWTSIDLDISTAGRELYEYGQDLHFHDFTFGWTVENDDFSMILVDNVRTEVGPPYGNDLMLAQREFLDNLPGRSPTHLIGYEAAGGRNKVNNHHLNIYSPTGMPELPDWSDPRFDPYEYPYNLVLWARSKGYATAYNHIFGAKGGADYLPEQRRDEIARKLVLNNAYGCDLLEVGYDNRARPIEDHIATWDALSMKNAFITATGVSDHHKALDWELTLNRFVSWVRVKNIKELSVLGELLFGRTWFGDPLIVGSKAFVDLDDTAGRFAMGDVVVSNLSTANLAIGGQVKPSNMDMSVITIHAASRDTAQFEIAGGLDPFAAAVTVNVSDQCHVRVEFRERESGNLVMASNPIYFRRSPPSRELTGMRLRNIVDLRPE